MAARGERANAAHRRSIFADLSGKYLDFAMQLGKPQAPIAYIWHTEWPDGQYRFQGTERAAKSSGVDLQSRGIKDIAEVDNVIDTMKKGGALTLIVQPSPFTYRHRTRIIDSARPCRWDDSVLASRGTRGRIDRVRPSIRIHESPSCLLRCANP
jgi:hypothetical protein